MSQGISTPPHVAAQMQQQAILNKLRVDLAAGLHRELVAKTFSFGPQCLPGDEWKLAQAEAEGTKVPIEEMRRLVAREAVAQAESLMEALGFTARREESGSPG